MLHIIEIKDIHNVALVSTKREFVFGIVTKKRTYYIQASSKEELDKWLTQLQNQTLALYVSLKVESSFLGTTASTCHLL